MPNQRWKDTQKEKPAKETHPLYGWHVRVAQQNSHPLAEYHWYSVFLIAEKQGLV